MIGSLGCRSEIPNEKKGKESLNGRELYHKKDELRDYQAEVINVESKPVKQNQSTRCNQPHLNLYSNYELHTIALQRSSMLPIFNCNFVTNEFIFHC